MRTAVQNMCITPVRAERSTVCTHKASHCALPFFAQGSIKQAPRNTFWSEIPAKMQLWWGFHILKKGVFVRFVSMHIKKRRKWGDVDNSVDNVDNTAVLHTWEKH